MDEFYLNVDSKDRTSGTIENFQYQYTSKGVLLNERYLAQLTFLEFPSGCIYQINSTNNVFRYQINSSTVVALNVEHGNYTVNELISVLNTEIASSISSLSISNFVLTLSYNTVYNKIGIIETGTNTGSNSVTLLFSGSNNMNEILGLTENITSSTSIQYLKNQVDMSPLDYVFLNCSEISMNNFTNNTFSSSQVLFRIPLAVQRNSKQYLSTVDLSGANALIPSLKSQFNFYLTDRLGREVSLNGVDYSFQIKLTRF